MPSPLGIEEPALERRARQCARAGIARGGEIGKGLVTQHTAREGSGVAGRSSGRWSGAAQLIGLRRILLLGRVASDVSGLCCCRSARRRGAHRRCTARAMLARLIVARAGLARLGAFCSTAAADVAARGLRLLRRSHSSRRLRVPRQRRSGRAAGRTGKLLARRALRRHVRRGDVRDSPWPGDAWRRRVWGGRRARCGRHVRCRGRVRCGSRASCGRASRFSSLFPWLRGCGCRQRSRSDKECRDADVPLEHDTDLLSIAPGVNAGVACGFRLRTGRGLHAAYMACDKLDDQLFRIARVKNLEN